MDADEKREAEIVMMMLILVNLSAKVKLQEQLLEKLLAQELNGLTLENAYKKEIDVYLDRVMASFADVLPDRASMISELLKEMKKQKD